MRTEEGNANGGHGSAVLTYIGKAIVGDNGIAKGTSVEIGNNSVGVITDNNGRIIKIIFSTDNDLEIEKI